jgi:hypothetical protein
MNKHTQISISNNPDSVGGSITPACTCGWEGNNVGNHNNYQRTMLNDQFKSHTRTLDDVAEHLGVQIRKLEALR